MVPRPRSARSRPPRHRGTGAPDRGPPGRHPTRPPALLLPGTVWVVRGRRRVIVGTPPGSTTAGAPSTRCSSDRDSGRGRSSLRKRPRRHPGGGLARLPGRRRPVHVAGRRDAFIGWVAEELDPSVDLATALVGHPNRGRAAVSSGRDRGFTAGQPRRLPDHGRGHRSGWRCHTSPVRAASLLGSGTTPIVWPWSCSSACSRAVALLLARAVRALQMMEASTAQLRFQALQTPHRSAQPCPHPRRISQLTARWRRDGVPMAAFYSTWTLQGRQRHPGHGAGDQLLVEVGNRSRPPCGRGHGGPVGRDEFVSWPRGRRWPAGSSGGRPDPGLAVAPFQLDESRHRSGSR